MKGSRHVEQPAVLLICETLFCNWTPGYSEHQVMMGTQQEKT
jgi:hypothetical protein